MTPSKHRRMAVRASFVLIMTGILYGYAQTVPSDPQTNSVTCRSCCLISANTLNSWFTSGTVSLNGPVNPADSVNFPNTPNCSFYEWSCHMFLWLTSPVIGALNGRVFESPMFFDVSPPDTTGRRSFVTHTPEFPSRLQLLNRQFGPHLLPIIKDKKGRMFEVEPPPKEVQPPRIRSNSGALSEVSRVQIDESGKKVFFDKKGGKIEPRFFSEVPAKPLNPRERKPLMGMPRAHGFIIDRAVVILDDNGNLIDVELGETESTVPAGGLGTDVLIAQNGSPIYYAISVNDVYAYFRTVQKDPLPNLGFPDSRLTFPGLMFPTQQLQATDLDTTGQHKFNDLNALAVQVKTAWIEASTIPNPDDYVTITATIPVFNKNDPKKWVQKGENTTKLAMVGMHVVGSTKGHPEMIWATFEHIGNAPNGDYKYNNKAGGVTSVPQDTSGTWLFFDRGSHRPLNTAENVLDTSSGSSVITAHDHILINNAIDVEPDKIIRVKPWGFPSDVNFPRTPEASNAEIIATNNSVRGVLLNGDVRRNYILTGATWLADVRQHPIPPPVLTVVGTISLANTTMETFRQGSDGTLFSGGGLNCMNCHGGGSDNTTVVSHVFASLKPLTPTPTPKPRNDAVIGTVTLPNPTPYQGSTKDYHLKVNVTNTGTNNWTAASGYRLGVASEMRLHEKSISSITSVVPPGSPVTFDVVVSCESLETSNPGSLTLQMQEGTTWFGQKRTLSVCQKEPRDTDPNIHAHPDDLHPHQ
jgi:hypothetical protein